MRPSHKRTTKTASTDFSVAQCPTSGMRAQWRVALCLAAQLLVCGLNAEEGEVKPLTGLPPLFLISGTQKSGTTVLASLLASHPNVSFSDKKELHFFDKTSIYRKGIKSYLSHFNFSEKTLWMGEATPAYLPSRLACSRIAQHFPDTKMIVLLREPVARAYSEYQMKARRVHEQEQLLNEVHTHVDEVHNCIVMHPEDFQAIDACLPLSVREHGRVGKLKKALRLAHDKLRNWSHVQELCFSRHHTAESECSTDADGVYVCSPVVRLVFYPQRCWTYYPTGFERVANESTALVGELEAFMNCSGPLFGVEGDGVLDLDLQAKLQWLSDAVARCIHVQSGISRQFFYRSMYAVQLFHCFQFLPPSQFLVLGSSELRVAPHAAVARVLGFLGLSTDTSWLPEAPQDLERMAQAAFPDFERTTAWRLKAEYAPLRDDIAQHLARFFEQQNELLFDLLGQSFGPEW